MSTEIFDRQQIVGIIQLNCLEAEIGAGTVVLSPQKSGKSYLLDYIYRRRDPQQNTFYCRINVDELQVRVRPGEKLSDEVFLRYFLSKLRDEFDGYLAREAEREETRRKQVERDEAKLLSGEQLEPDLQRLLEANLVAVKGYLSDLQRLRQYVEKIDALLGPASISDSFVFYELLDELLAKLKRMKKRLVIFIDDVHQIVGNHEFTETLLSLLRGASSDGKLIPLLTTRLELMHPSLHQRSRGDQTRSLFNDVKVEFLNSFTDDEALNFLNWLPSPGPALSDEDRQYVLSLSGGSPHFLKEVHDRFVRTRPEADARKRFELEVGQVVATAFETVWTRCTPKQREAIYRVQAGEINAWDADLGPAVCFARAAGDSFATLFANFLAGMTEQPDVVVAAAPAFRIFPTALCIADPESTVPLVTFTINNPTARKVKVRLECELEQFSLERKQTIDVPAGEQINVALQVILRRKAADGLINPEPTQIRWKAELNPGFGATVIGEDTVAVRVLAVDQFVFASRDEVQSRIINYSWLIAAWVNAENEAVRELARQATEKVKAAHGPASGYPIVGGPAAEEAVTAQVEELYNALRARNLVYQNRTAAPFSDPFDGQDLFSKKTWSQRVRLPGRSLKEGCANCLDASVLFASMLAALDLDPVILFLPDHALVGWKTVRGPAADMKFLEITDVADGEKDFAAALASGMNYYEARSHLVTNDPNADIAYPFNNLAIVVDVRAVWQARTMGLLPNEL